MYIKNDIHENKQNKKMQGSLTFSSGQNFRQLAQLTPLMYAVAIFRMSSLKGCSMKMK